MSLLCWLLSAQRRTFRLLGLVLNSFTIHANQNFQLAHQPLHTISLHCSHTRHCALNTHTPSRCCEQLVLLPVSAVLLLIDSLLKLHCFCDISPHAPLSWAPFSEIPWWSLPGWYCPVTLFHGTVGYVLDGLNGLRFCIHFSWFFFLPSLPSLENLS